MIIAPYTCYLQNGNFSIQRIMSGMIMVIADIPSWVGCLSDVIHGFKPVYFNSLKCNDYWKCDKLYNAEHVTPSAWKLQSSWGENCPTAEILL